MKETLDFLFFPAIINLVEDKGELDMLTLQILAGWLVLGLLGSIVLLKDGYREHARIMFLNMTIAPVGLLVLLILVIGLAPTL